MLKAKQQAVGSQQTAQLCRATPKNITSPEMVQGRPEGQDRPLAGPTDQGSPTSYNQLTVILWTSMGLFGKLTLDLRMPNILRTNRNIYVFLLGTSYDQTNPGKRAGD